MRFLRIVPRAWALLVTIPVVMATGCSSPNDTTVGKETTPEQFKSEGAARAQAFGPGGIPTKSSAKPASSPEAAARAKAAGRR